jgi:hypothetical protein
MNVTKAEIQKARDIIEAGIDGCLHVVPGVVKRIPEVGDIWLNCVQDKLLILRHIGCGTYFCVGCVNGKDYTSSRMSDVELLEFVKNFYSLSEAMDFIK